MAWSFGDGFDLYATSSDMFNNYWDSGANVGGMNIVAGRFAGGRAMQHTVNSNAVKNSGANDAVHHLVVAFQQGQTITGSTVGSYLQLSDGATAQCSIVFRSDGAILLTSGSWTGTVLATYTGAFPVINIWYAFEIEVVINNTTGSFTVRKNGNPANDFTATGLNTRGGTANNYANRLQFGAGAASVSQVSDDLFWRSDAVSVAWMGDIRCYTRMPNSDQGVQFSRSPPSVTQTPFTFTTNQTIQIAWSFYTPVSAIYDGTVSVLTIPLTAGWTGNLKCSIFNDSANNPGTIRASATTITNPVTGTNTFTFGTPFTVTGGTRYWVGFAADASISNAFQGATSGTTSRLSTTTGYTAFPTASPAVGNNNATIFTWTITTTANYSMVAEAQQDALSSYVYDSVAGHADFYGLAGIGSTPATVHAVTTRGFMQKSDAGGRTAAVQVRSGYSSTLSTWNPADLSNVTLTGSNLIATVGGGSGGARSTTAFSSGKYYWENTWTISSNGITSGIALATANLTSPTTGWARISRISGNIIINGADQLVSISGGVAVPNSSVIGIAVDFTAQLIWFRLGAAGNWNGSGTANPAAATGGLSIASIAGPLFAGMVGQTGDIVAGNFGTSAFTGAVPSGFTAGLILTITGATVATPNLTLTTSGWQWAWRTDLVDPNTGAAWTAAAVDVASIGPLVVS